MKRDMDLVRKLMIVIEDRCVPGALTPISVEGYSEDQIDYHIDLLKEVGFVDGSFFIKAQSREFLGNCHMTWAGHDFLDAIRDDAVWSKRKEKIIKFGVGAFFELVKTLGVAAALAHLS